MLNDDEEGLPMHIVILLILYIILDAISRVT
jgi:hypothetical protein